MEERIRSIELGIGAYEKKEQAAREKAIRAICEGLYETASRAVVEAAKCQACIEELQFQQECMEVE